MDTIYALSTARGRAGIAVVRVSGPAATAAGVALCGALPSPRTAALRTLRRGGEVLDRAMVLRFSAGASATGEDVVEFHLHGGPAVVAAVLGALAAVPGLRPAEPGEFTRRAFENGRMTLTEVEGLGDLLQAETEAQRRQAMRGFDGALRRAAEGWRGLLIEAAALLEATIDFVEEDVPVDVGPTVRALLARVVLDMERELSGFAVAERLRDGFEVAIVGAPNVGKSTLLNRLAGRDAAIVSSEAGTTRDVIEVRMDLAGLPVTLIDTAGLREASDPVEAIGVARGRDRAQAADLRIILVEDGRLPEGVCPSASDIVLRAKADGDPGEGEGVSGATGAGVDALLERIASILSARVAVGGLVTRERQRAAVFRAKGLLESAMIGLDRGQVAELVAEDIRGALAAIEALAGRVDVEMVLGAVFSQFCIGK